jgi:hypothetical protein
VPNPIATSLLDIQEAINDFAAGDEYEEVLAFNDGDQGIRLKFQTLAREVCSLISEAEGEYEASKEDQDDDQEDSSDDE